MQSVDAIQSKSLKVQKENLSNPNNVRKAINAAISERFNGNSRVILINHDTIFNLDNEENRREVMTSNGHYFTNEGFKKMLRHWIKYIEIVTDRDYSKPDPLDKD